MRVQTPGWVDFERRPLVEGVRDHVRKVFGDWTFVISEGTPTYVGGHDGGRVLTNYFPTTTVAYREQYTEWEDTLSDLASRPKKLHLVRLYPQDNGHWYWWRPTYGQPTEALRDFFEDAGAKFVNNTSGEVRLIWLTEAHFVMLKLAGWERFEKETA